MKDGSNYEVCIVGLGPSGVGAVLTLANSRFAPQVICLEQGGPSNSRVCSVLQSARCEGEKPCQIISGFGGCSLLSAGKISAFPAGGGLVTIMGSKDLVERKLREAITLLGSYIPLQKPNMQPSEITSAKELFGKLGFEYKYFNAYQFDQEKLSKAYGRIYLQLESAGIPVSLHTTLVNVSRQEPGFKLIVRKHGHDFTIGTRYLVLGVGRSGQSILNHMNTELDLRSKEGQLDVGVRLEFPTDLFPEVTRYHNDLKLLFNGARTFCVCKDGIIAPYVLEDVLYTDGYCNPRNRSGLTNLGIITRLRPSNRNRILLDEIRKKALWQRSGKLVCQDLPGYLRSSSKGNKTLESYRDSDSFWTWGEVNDCFPLAISATIRKAVLYFAERLLPMQRWEEVKVFGPEVNYAGISFPVESNFSICPGLFIVGDCTGQFRGIAQAFCSGIICAENLIGNGYDKAF